MKRPFRPRLGWSNGDLALIKGVGDHVAEWIGDPLVFHERVSRGIHIDVYLVPADADRDFHTLVTSGMAERPMVPPAEVEGCTHAELVLFLPPEWPVHRIPTDESASWPVRLLQQIAAYPHDLETWLWFGHTVNLGPQMAVGCNFSSVLLYYPLLLEPDGDTLALEDGRRITFLGVVLLRPEELEFDMNKGLDALMDLAEQRGRVQDILILNLERKSLLLAEDGS